MSDSVSESVDDNGNSVHPEVMNHGLDSVENVSVNGLLVDVHEESSGSPQQSNKIDSFRVESPGSRRKGFGLKKWRRIKRDGPVVKDEGTPVDDGGKLLKRGLTGLVNPPSKHVDFSSVEARQSSEGSVGSVNMAHHHPGVVNGFSPDTGFIFTLGQAFEKSEEHSGNSTAAKNVAGRSDTIKKVSEERAKTKIEKPCSSLDSDLRSSDFVFSSGAVSVANHGEKDERLMNQFGEFRNGQAREEVHTYSRSENGDREEGGDESKKNNQYWADKDLIADSIKNLAALQEALWKEVQSFQELGKESVPLHSNIDELSSSNQTGNEYSREENSTSSGSQVLILKQKVKHLEHKLEEARAVLEAKEAKIQELENSRIETELEGIFQRKIESEIEHLMLQRSVESLRVPKKVHFVTEDPEPNHGNILGKTCKFGFYFLTQMILLVSILRFLVLQYSPASSLVIPT